MNALARARAAAAEARARRRAADLREVIADTGRRFPYCHCKIRANSKLTTVRALGGGCTMPNYACPRLDAIRRRTEGWTP